MSHVRLSNASPTLERMEARQADYPKPSACRNLFGPVDHDELARELRKHRRDLEESSRRKWNFDFHRERPLDGRYEWQALGHDALPDFYSRAPRLGSAAKQAAHPGQKKAARRGGAAELHHHHHHHHGGGGGCPPASAAFRRSQGISEEEEEEGDPEEDGAVEPGADGTAAAAGQRKRPASGDSSPRNKRANTTEEAISEGSSSASSVEQTPKKSSPRLHRT